MIILAEVSPVDPVAGARVLLRATSHNTADGTGVNSLSWCPALMERPTIAIRLFKGEFDGTAAASGGTLKLAMQQLAKDYPDVGRYFWPGSPVKLWAGTAGQAWPWSQVFEGVVDADSGFSREGNTLSIKTKVNAEPFEADLLTAKYAGTGGIEGGDDLKEQPKPFVVGRVFNIAPTLINAVDNVYQVHGYGAIQAIPKLYERGSEFDAPLADYANYAALVAATIAPGSWATCLAQGLFRLGAPAYGLITADVDGDKAGGTWRRRPGEIILRMCELAGVSSGLIESASFTAMDSNLAALSNLGRIGWYQTEQTSVIDLAAQFASDVNHVVGVSMLGKLFASSLTPATPTLRLDAQNREGPTVYAPVVERNVSPPYSLIELGYARCWRVHTADEIASYDISPATQEALDIINAANGKVTSGGPLPSVADSSVGDLHIGDDGTLYQRVNSGGIIVGSNVVVLAGFRPVLHWTPAVSQPVAAGIRFGLQAIDEAQAAQLTADIIGEQVAIIASDAWLSTTEKPTLKVVYDALIRNHAALDAKAASLGIAATERGNATASINALNSFLSGLTPSWTNPDVDTPWNGATAKSLFDDAHNKVALLQAAIQGIPGDDGAPGTRFVSVYRRSATLPSTPTGNLTPTDWSLTRPAANGQPMWESRGEISGASTLVGSWATPVQVEAVTPVGVRFDVARSGSFTVSLNNSESIAVSAVSTINAGTGGSSSFTLQLRSRPVGGSYSNFGAADSDTLASGDGGGLSVSDSFINSSGAPQRYEIEALLTKTGAGSHAESAGQSFLRA